MFWCIFFAEQPPHTFRSLARPRCVLRISSLHFWNLLMILLRFKKKVYGKRSKISDRKSISKFVIVFFPEIFQWFSWFFRFFENFQWKYWFFRFSEIFKFSMKIQWTFWFFKNFEKFWSTFWNRFSIRKFWYFPINFF